MSSPSFERLLELSEGYTMKDLLSSRMKSIIITNDANRKFKNRRNPDPNYIKQLKKTRLEHLMNIVKDDLFIILKYHINNKILLSKSLDIIHFLLNCTSIKKVYYEEISELENIYVHNIFYDDFVNKMNETLKKRYGFTKKYICSICQKNKKVRKCEKCLKKAYCSKECQMKNYKIHKTQCIPPVSKNTLNQFMPHLDKYIYFLRNNININ